VGNGPLLRDRGLGEGRCYAPLVLFGGGKKYRLQARAESCFCMAGPRWLGDLTFAFFLLASEGGGRGGRGVYLIQSLSIHGSIMSKLIER